MVAKSYQNFSQVCDPYLVNGRWYVKVDTGKNIRQVRWYSAKEYEKLYGEKAPVDEKSYKSQKDVLGFSEGYITIFRGDTFEHKEALKEAGARYTRWWGWGISGGSPIPSIEGLTPIKLNWEVVGDENGYCFNEAQVLKALEPYLYETENNLSTYQGSIGERLRNIPVKITACNSFTSNYGERYVFNFEDENGNVYVWFTTSKKNTTEKGASCLLTGTVKEHNTYKGIKQTILSRCVLS